MPTPIETIEEKVSRLRDADPEFKLFGASTHRYTARQPAKEADLCAFEELHAVDLPRDYRDYLTHIGDGGVGPYYGIAGLDDHAYLDLPETAPDLSAPFPHRRGWNRDKSFFEKWESLQEAEDEDGIERLELDYWSPRWFDGALEICHYGCALRFLLVVKGPEKGTIWFNQTPDWNGIQPVCLVAGQDSDKWMTSSMDTDERVGLLDWMAAWLGHSLRQLGQ